MASLSSCLKKIKAAGYDVSTIDERMMKRLEKAGKEQNTLFTYLDEIVRGHVGFRSHVFGMDYTWASFLDDCRAIQGAVNNCCRPCISPVF